MNPNLITESVNSEMDYRRERIARSFGVTRRHLRGGHRRQRPGRLEVVPPYGDARA